MTSQTTNQFGDNNGREQVHTPGKGLNDAKTLTVGVKRGEFPDGAATVLVLDHFGHLYASYGARIPQECNLLFVSNTQSAEQAMIENPAISVVIAQGLSCKVTNPMIDEIREKWLDSELILLGMLRRMELQGEPVHEWLDSYQNTMNFLKFLQQRDFGGLVQVVSNSLKSYQRSELCDLKNLRVQCMDKRDFLLGTFVDKMDKLWERIARLEQYEAKVGRKLTPVSEAGRWFNQLMEKAIVPHTAEDRLFDRWQSWSRDCLPYRAEAVEMVLTDLEQLKQLIAQGDVRRIYEYATSLVDDRRTCDCREFDDTVPPEYRWARYLHVLHRDVNQAAWEILDMAGLMEWVQLELEFDLASSPARTYKPEFGRHLRRSFGEQLREFFRPEGPSERWVVDPRAIVRF